MKFKLLGGTNCEKVVVWGKLMEDKYYLIGF